MLTDHETKTIRPELHSLILGRPCECDAHGSMPAREVAVGVPYLHAVLCVNPECQAIYSGTAHRDACPNCGEFGALNLARILGRKR